ncbi:MAG: DsbA family protein [Candidatus Magasanikbacteria bacterium]|nr:DsbA family protein [Candidatus Magasanikbacteria bacterium]
MEEEIQNEHNLTKRERRDKRKEEDKENKEKAEKSKKIKNIVIWGVVGVLVVVGFWWLKNNIETSPKVENPQEIRVDDVVKGNPEAVAVLVEYADFQCGGCKQYSSVVSGAYEKMSGGLQVVYRHYPLESIHPNAFDASRASEAARKQDKFWEMHDLLYSRQSSWASSSKAKEKFVEYAEELGLDRDKFLQDFSSDEVENKIKTDIASGNAMNVQGTPTFFLNGERFEPNTLNVELFTSAIESSL